MNLVSAGKNFELLFARVKYGKSYFYHSCKANLMAPFSDGISSYYARLSQPFKARGSTTKAYFCYTGFI